MDLALIALSARPLATSAARAGLSTLALDVRATMDLPPGGKCLQSHACLPAQARSADGARSSFDAAALPAALASHLPAGIPFIPGDGLDVMPEVLAQISARNPILGNTPTTVRVLKDPLALQALCGHLRIPFPTVSLTAPDAQTFAGATVLEKRIGSSGGGSVRRRAADDLSAPAPGHYLQREVAGQTFSLLLLGNGKACIPLGISRHFAVGTENATTPFRQDGRLGPVPLPEALQASIITGAQNIALACGLVGLVSVRVIISNEGWFVLGVTPHPDASLDLFDTEPLPPLLALHLAACGGRMPAGLAAPSQVRAIASLHAAEDLTMPALASPATVLDAPRPGTAVVAGDLVATVHVNATSAMQAEVTLMAAVMQLSEQLRKAAV